MSQTLGAGKSLAKVSAADERVARLLSLGRTFLAAYRNRSRRRLFMTVFGGLGVAAAYGVDAALRRLLASAAPPALITYPIMVSLSLFIGTMMWDRFVTREIRGGRPLPRIRYLEEEYQDDLDRIKRLPLSAADRTRRIAAREDLFNREREQLRRDLLES